MFDFNTKHAYILFICAIVGTQTACNSLLPNENKTIDKPYFDLIAYCQQQSQQIEGKAINKTVILNGEKENQKTIVRNGLQELSALNASDINKPAFRDSYLSDTTHIGNDTMRITYTAQKAKLRTQLLTIEILMPQNTVISIAVQNKVQNPLYTLSEQLYYSPLKKYTIKSQQQVLWLHNNNFEIETSF